MHVHLVHDARAGAAVHALKIIFEIYRILREQTLQNNSCSECQSTPFCFRSIGLKKGINLLGFIESV